MTFDLPFCWECTVRLLGATLLGAAIGLEREIRGKGAGIRTHLLVALGSALFMIVSMYAFPDASRFDASRVAAGVVGGLGFLCAGIIMKNRHISGLTTAAGLWVTGAVGLAMGGGMYEVSVLTTVVMIRLRTGLAMPREILPPFLTFFGA